MHCLVDLSSLVYQPPQDRSWAQNTEFVFLQLMTALVTWRLLLEAIKMVLVLEAVYRNSLDQRRFAIPFFRSSILMPLLHLCGVANFWWFYSFVNFLVALCVCVCVCVCVPSNLRFCFNS
jgi:hypothetical protein